MSTFYGTVGDNWGRRTNATRCGHKSIFAAAQSYNGSIITELEYDGDTLMVSVEHAKGSSSSGWCIFHGTMDEFLEVVRLGKAALNEGK